MNPYFMEQQSKLRHQQFIEEANQDRQAAQLSKKKKVDNQPFITMTNFIKQQWGAVNQEEHDDCQDTTYRPHSADCA